MSILGTGWMLTAMAQPSTYKRAYKKFGTKATKNMLRSMQRQATAINSGNQNMFKKALEYTPPVQRSNPQQNIGQASGLAFSKQTIRRRHTSSSSRRSKVSAYTR